MLSQIDDELTVPPALDMINDLLNDSEKCIKIFKMVYDLSEREEEYGLSNFLAERIDAHKKHSWMLRATLK
jgi:DNA-binding ferritin-like protein